VVEVRLKGVDQGLVAKGAVVDNWAEAKTAAGLPYRAAYEAAGEGKDTEGPVVACWAAYWEGSEGYRSRDGA